MEQLKSEQASLSTAKRQLDRQLKQLMRFRYGGPYYGYDSHYARTRRELTSQLSEVNSRLSQINKIIADSDRELVTSMTVMPTDTVVDMSTLLNIFHNNIITKLAKNLIPAEDLETLSTKQKKIEYITKNIPKDTYLDATRTAINEMSGDEVNKAIKYIRNKYNMLDNVKLNSAVPERKLAIKKFIYNTFVKDPSKRNPTKFPRGVTRKIAEYVGVKAGKRKTYKKNM